MDVMNLNISYDVRTDSGGKDPDFASSTLKKYHQLLWSKPLPNGQFLDLQTGKGCYLKWDDMYFGSDSIIVSFMHDRYKLRKQIEDSIPNFSSFLQSEAVKSS